LRRARPKPALEITPKRRTVIAIGDIHFPFEHEPTLAAILNTVKDAQPDVIIQMGDLYDLYSSSKYPRSHNIMTPREERLLGRAKAEAFWGQIRKISPKSTCYQLFGNHDLRVFKRTLESIPAAEDEIWESLVRHMCFDGVKLCKDFRQPLIIDGVAYEHGALKHGTHFLDNGMSTVVAHTHVGGTVHKGNIWELNVGWAGDNQAQVFDYVRSKLVAKKTTHGVGIVDHLGPRFVPL